MDASSPPKNVLDLMPSLKTSGYRLVDAGELAQFFQTFYTSYSSIAAAGTTAANATRLGDGVVDITAAAVGSGVMLPPSLPGKEATIINDTATAVLVYGYTGRSPADTVTPNSSITPAASVTLAANATAVFICGKQGNWKMMVSA